MPGDDATVDDEPYCSLRADNEDRWAFIRRSLDPDHDSLLDLGCAEGYFTHTAARDGLEASGIEAKRSRYESAVSQYGDHENVRFEHRRITLETVADLPATDVTLVLTVHHHWVDAFGIEAATKMLERVLEKTSMLFYEPPGTMFLGNPNRIDLEESIERYREYLVEEFGDRITIVDVAMFPHVDEGKYEDRSDPLFAIETASGGE